MIPLLSGGGGLTLQAKLILLGLAVLAVLVLLTALGVIDWGMATGAGLVSLGGLLMGRQQARRRQAGDLMRDVPDLEDTAGPLADEARVVIHNEAERDRAEVAAAVGGTGPSPAEVARMRRGRR